MAVHQPSTYQAKRASISLLLQPINNNIQPAMTAQALALEKLGRSVDMTVFQELLDLDTPSELFSKDVVSEYLVLGPESLSTMRESLYVECFIFYHQSYTNTYPLEHKSTFQSSTQAHNHFAAHQWC